MIETVLEKGVAFLRVLGTDFGQFAHLRIVIDVEMGCLHDLPIKAIVDHLVAAEIVLAVQQHIRQQQQDKQENEAER